MSSTARDPDTGRLLYPVEVVVSLGRGHLPQFVSCSSMSAAVRYLASKDFRDIRHRIQSVTITDREAS